MSILVVGGAGYIGSHCVKKLIEEGYDVCVVDNLSTGHLQALDKKARFYKGDIRDFIFLNRLFKKESIDAVIHFAANSLVGESMTEPLRYFDNNVYGTQGLLTAMLANNIKKIVFSSSAAVYGEPKVVPITEDSETNPTNPYGQTKLMMEQIMKWSDKAYGLKYIALRYFNVAGADISSEIGEVHNPETHLIPIVLQVVLGKRKELTIFGSDYPTKDGTNIRDYIHIDDLIDAHILALKKLLDGSESDVINLGSASGYSNLEIVNTARKVTGHPIPLVMGDRRQGDPAILVASSDKAKKVLGWEPKLSIEDMIRSAYNFHKKHPEGYE